MQAPSLTDTIVAVSSAWSPAAVGIVRLSGLQAYACAASLGAAPPHTPGRPVFDERRLRIDESLELPATVYWFAGPRSYTGQDVVELHVPGCLPALRRLCARLLEVGARRALPGEFTSRAFLNGRMASAEVDGVLELVYAGSRSAARQAARLTRGTDRGRLEDISERLTELIALIEAGIDFVEEEDVQFITPAQVRERIDNLLGRIERFGKRTEPSGLRGRPHIALVGLPNAGKSTLFNALVGRERAIVAPVLGTTRDVLSAEVRIEGVDVVVQDCAGLGDSADDLDLAAHRLAEEAADRADLVLWVHDHRAPWAPSETACCERIEPDRRILVWSKADLAGGAVRRLRIEFAEGIRVSAATSEGLNDLRRAAIEWIGRAGAAAGGLLARELGSVAEALRRARGLVAQSGDRLEDSELLALDLRTAWERIDGVCRGPLVEEVLGKIFSRFCIGK